MSTYLLCYEIQRLDGSLPSKGHQIILVEKLDADALKTHYHRILEEAKAEFPQCDFGPMVWTNVNKLDP